MCQQEDVHPSRKQRVQRSQELRELFREDDVALSVAKILDARFIGMLADILDEQLFQPVRGIDYDRAEIMFLTPEGANRGGNVLPGLRRWQPSDVEVMRAALSIE